MSILLALNGFNVLTGQPEHDPEWEENKHLCEHDSHEGGNELDWKRNAKTLGIEDKIRFQHLNIEHLEFSDLSFDAIFMYDTLQHIKNKKKALNECLRILKHTGLICIIEWNERSIKEDEEKYGFKIDYINPKDFLERNDVSIELINGNYVNILLIKFLDSNFLHRMKKLKQLDFYIFL
jgi:ubiquinone/menaquinone biosynthesis C-methylase UbiE